MRQRLTALLLVWSPGVTWAESGLTSAPAPSSGATVQMSLYILLLLALFAAGAWILRRGVPGMASLNRGERRLHLRETRSLGGRQFLVVAEYDGRKMLLGVCPGRIEHLCELGEEGPEREFPKVEEGKGS